MFMGFAERIALRRRVARGIVDGDLPLHASVILSNPDAFNELERMTVSRAAAASHPILAWIAANWQTILKDILALLPLFGVNVPNIPLPLGTTTTANPNASGDPTQPTAALPTEMALPVWAIPLVEQLVAQALQKVLPVVEAKIQEWVNTHSAAA